MTKKQRANKWIPSWYKGASVISAPSRAATASTTLTPTQQARRLRILEATRTLVGEHGYDGMIMRDIATAASVSPTTLYNLYNTKDELVLEALRDRVSQDFQQAEAAEPQLGMNRLFVQLRESIGQTRENPVYARTITRALFRANEGDEIIRVLIYGTAHNVANSLRAMATAKQLIAGTDIERLATALMSGFWAQYYLWATNVIDIKHLEQELTRAYLVYLAPVVTGSARRLLKEMEKQYEW